jgi:restriction system protein
LTSSRFSKEAQQASVKKGAITILLLDGAAITDLMVEKDLGVVKTPVYTMELDSTFFNFDE